MNTRTDHQPVRGLPEKLPAGENIVWQGSSDWRSLARRMFRFRLLAVYFLALVAWRIASSLNAGTDVGEAVVSAFGPVMLAALAFAVLAVIAWLIQRTTVYTITNKRVAMRFGVALPMTINLPFKAIASVDAKINNDGTGDLSIVLSSKQRVSYISLWPHARPWKFRHPQPMLRCIPEAAHVAETIAAQLAAAGLEPIVEEARPETDKKPLKPAIGSTPQTATPATQS